jgi:hypothetical protein
VLHFGDGRIVDIQHNATRRPAHELSW